MVTGRAGCPCECRCLEEEFPHGGCRCLEDGCPCAEWEADVWHTPKLVMKTKMDAYSQFFAGACTCGWISDGLETEPHAWVTARQHTVARNAQLYTQFMEEMADGDRREEREEGVQGAAGGPAAAGRPPPGEHQERRRQKAGPGPEDA